MSTDAENLVSYEQLEELENDFEEVELEIRESNYFCRIVSCRFCPARMRRLHASVQRRAGGHGHDAGYHCLRGRYSR